ncbi:MAG TPA: glycosyltransferase family 4 protein [Anaerolineales bacterium]|nr:glycosyltransferase family 4 protein [Anaerolineales bacterium]
MRILYFSKDYSTHDHRFLSAIAGGGHEVFYLKLEHNARQVEDRPVPSQVEQIQWAGGRGPFRWRDVPRLALDLKRVIWDLKPDLVHAGPIQTCAFLAVLTGFRPILTMSWGFDLMQDVHRNRWWEWVTRYTLTRSTFFTSDADVTRDKAVAYGMNPNHTVVFPWGIDLEKFAPNTARRSRSKSFTLFCNRSWEPRYGVDVLAKAFVKVAASKPEVGLILLNGGSQSATLRQILQNDGVLDRVHFGGQISQNDLPDWYHMADLYISPSHVDGSSVSLMEALACGLPALVSDIPANKEWVTDHENGWLFRDGDVDDLAAKILQAIESRKSLKKIGTQARAVAEARADWKKNAATLLQTYRTVLSLK